MVSVTRAAAGSDPAGTMGMCRHSLVPLTGVVEEEHLGTWVVVHTGRGHPAGDALQAFVIVERGNVQDSGGVPGRRSGSRQP